MTFWVPRKQRIKPRWLNVLDKVLFAVTIVNAIAMLASYLAPYADPSHFFFIAVLGFVYQLLLVLSLALFLYWVLRRSVLCFLPVLILLVGYPTLSTYLRLQIPHGAKSGSPGTIRLLQYNVHSFKGLGDSASYSTKQRIIDLIRSQHADVVCLEEFNQLRKVPDSIVADLSRELNMPYHFFYASKRRKTELNGNAVFSKLPIIDSGTIVPDRRKKVQAIFADIQIKNKIIRFYSIHLNAVNMATEAKEQFLEGDLKSAAPTSVISGLHQAFVIRSKQVSIIKDHINKSPYAVVVAGDLNDTPNSFSVHQLSKGLNNAFIQCGSGMVTTYYSVFPLHIDHVLVDPHLQITSYSVIDKKVSDHKAVVVDLNVR